MLRDLAVIAALVGIAAAVFAWLILREHGPSSGRPLGGPNVDVSNYGYAQFEVSAAVDPRSPNVLLAGSNDENALSRVYQSTDGGLTWQSRPGPPLPDAAPCGLGDPAVAIGPNGRQYYALLVDAFCDDSHLYLWVGTRAGPHGRWRARRVEPKPSRPYKLDDKPAIAIDLEEKSPHHGRAYLAWSKWYTTDDRAIAVSHSDDGGRTWSKPVAVDRGDGAPVFAAIAVGPGGVVYLTYQDAYYGDISVTASRNGGSSFGAPRRIAEFGEKTYRECRGEEVANIDAIPAQPNRCVSPGTQIGVARGGVYVVFGKLEPNRTQGVYLVWLTPELTPGPLERVGPEDAMPSDQFWPAVAVDRRSGDIWICYYDTTGDRTRSHAWFTCTVSRDGRHWAEPVRAAEEPSDESSDDANPNEYGDYEAVVVADGVAHPFWTDSRDVLARQEEIYTARIPVTAFDD